MSEAVGNVVSSSEINVKRRDMALDLSSDIAGRSALAELPVPLVHLGETKQPLTLGTNPTDTALEKEKSRIGFQMRRLRQKRLRRKKTNMTSSVPKYLGMYQVTKSIANMATEDLEKDLKAGKVKTHKSKTISRIQGFRAKRRSFQRRRQQIMKANRIDQQRRTAVAVPRPSVLRNIETEVMEAKELEDEHNNIMVEYHSKKVRERSLEFATSLSTTEEDETEAEVSSEQSGEESLAACAGDAEDEEDDEDDEDSDEEASDTSSDDGKFGNRGIYDENLDQYVPKPVRVSKWMRAFLRRKEADGF